MGAFTKRLIKRKQHKKMAIKTYKFTGVMPENRDGKPVLDDDEKPMSLARILVRGLDQVDLREMKPNQPPKPETAGAIRERIRLADKISDSEGEEIQLESSEVSLLEKVITHHFPPMVSSLLLRHLDGAVVVPPPKPKLEEVKEG